MSTLRNFAILLAGTVFLWLLSGLVPRMVGPYPQQMLNLVGINIVLAVSLNLINGYTGQFSIGHLGFAAVGGYASATFVKYFAPVTWTGPLSLFVSLLIGGAVAGACGLLVGLPTLRLRGDYLAIATLGFGEIIRVVFLNIDEVPVGGRTIDLGGARGFTGIPHLSDFFWIWWWALLTCLVILNIVYSSPGRAFKSIREDELAAEVMGVNTIYYKVAAFVIGSFFAGVAGGLYAHEFVILHPTRFNFINSFDIVLMVVFGGMGSTTGAIFGAAFITILPEFLRDVSAFIGTRLGRPELDLRLVIYSLMLIVLMLVRPQGLMGSREITAWFHRKPKPPLEKEGMA